MVVDIICYYSLGTSLILIIGEANKRMGEIVIEKGEEEGGDTACKRVHTHRKSARISKDFQRRFRLNFLQHCFGHVADGAINNPPPEFETNLYSYTAAYFAREARARACFWLSAAPIAAVGLTPLHSHSHPLKHCVSPAIHAQMFLLCFVCFFLHLM